MGGTSLTELERNGVCQARGRQDGAVLFREASGNVFEVCHLFIFYEHLRCTRPYVPGTRYLLYGVQPLSGMQASHPYVPFPVTPRTLAGLGQCDSCALLEGSENCRSRQMLNALSSRKLKLRH